VQEGRARKRQTTKKEERGEEEMRMKTQKVIKVEMHPKKFLLKD
jgi:hypothetical protein